MQHFLEFIRRLAEYVEFDHYPLGCWQLENESNAC